MNHELRVVLGCIHPEHGGRGDSLVETVDGVAVREYRPAPGTVWAVNIDGRESRVWGPQ